VSEDRITEAAEVLHRAAETHHVVFGIVDGNDEDWATWYADWLVTLSELPEILGVTPVRSALTHALVQLDIEYAEQRPAEPWERFYAAALVDRFAPT
jgi:hypothetical protein